MADYLSELVERKRAAPGDDLMSHMVQASEAGVLSREEVISMAVLMLIAGHDTTVSLIGNGVLELLRAPDQLALLRSDPALLPNAVEETFSTLLAKSAATSDSATAFITASARRWPGWKPRSSCAALLDRFPGRR